MTFAYLPLVLFAFVAPSLADDVTTVLQAGMKVREDMVTLGRDSDWARRLRIDLRLHEAQLRGSVDSTEDDVCFGDTCFSKEGLKDAGYDLLIALKRNKKAIKLFREKALHQLKSGLDMDAFATGMAMSGKKVLIKEALLPTLRSAAMIMANGTQLTGLRSLAGAAGPATAWDHTHVGTSIAVSLGRGIGLEVGLSLRFSTAGKGTKICSSLAAIKDRDDAPLPVAKRELAQFPLYAGLGVGFDEKDADILQVGGWPYPSQEHGFAFSASLSKDNKSLRNFQVGLCFNTAKNSYGSCDGHAKLSSSGMLWCSSPW